MSTTITVKGTTKAALRRDLWSLLGELQYQTGYVVGDEPMTGACEMRGPREEDVLAPDPDLERGRAALVKVIEAATRKKPKRRKI